MIWRQCWTRSPTRWRRRSSSGLVLDGYLADGASQTYRAIARGLRPRERLSVSDWAGRYRRLSSKSAAEPGPWRNDRIPYLRAIMDALDTRHPAPLVVLMGSSQTGKSECGLNWIGKTIHWTPGSFLALFPSEKDARKWVRTRLQTMLAETPELRRLIPPGRRKDGESTLQEKHFPGGVLYTGSANIPSDLASISVPYVLLDEVDRYPEALDKEGDPVELGKRRTEAFSSWCKVFEASTPTTEEGSRIWRDYQASTQDRYYVPCPHCGHKQILRWEGLKWPDGKPELAAYACEDCAALIEERYKTQMLAAGEWRPTHPEREAEIKGFHISGLYTPIGLGSTWAKFARAWLMARGDPAKEQVFYNTRLGEVVRSEGARVEWEVLQRRAEPYRLRTIPAGVLLLTAGVDVQRDRLEVQILGHGRGERVTVVDYHVLPGDPTRDEVWRALDAFLAREIVSDGGRPLSLSAIAVDSSDLQHEVVNYTRMRKARGVFAVKGSAVLNRAPIGRPSLVDVNYRGQVYKRGAEQYQIGVSLLKATLYGRLKADEGKPDHPVAPSDRHVRFSADLGEDYFRQLSAEVFDPNARKWIKTYDRNEALDTFVYAMAAAMHHSVGVHRMRDADWARLEQQQHKQAVGEGKNEGPALGKQPIEAASGFLPTAALVKKG